MLIRPVSLRSPFVLVPGPRLQSQLLDLACREGFPQSPYSIASDLNALNAVGGIPVTLSEPLPGKSDWSLLLYTRRYLARLFVTKFGDAYTIASVAPLRLRDHQRLAQGYLLTRPRAWRVVDSPHGIPQGSASGWDVLVAGWDQLTASLATTSGPTERQDAFLSMLGEVIDATERITTASEGEDSYPYREARPTGGSRSGAAQAYEFTLAGVRVPQENAFVQVATRAGSGAAAIRVRGQVTRASGMTITIRFDEPVDWNDLRGQDEITRTSSTVVFWMQREALSQLRTGRARNPGVLPALVDGQADPPWAGQHVKKTPSNPAFRLNTHQREAFDKTLAGPDLLAVIGPPGTGKTSTITEIVRGAKARGERVIVCSQNNRAVDNVLGRLPEDLLAIRVGNEARVTPEGIPYLLQRQAADLRTQTLNRSRPKLEAYDRLGEAEGWGAELTQRNAALTSARRGEAEALANLDSARLAAGGTAAEEVTRLTEVHAARELGVRRSAAREERLRSRSERAAARSMWVIIGWLFGLLSRRWAEKAHNERARSSALASAHRDAAANLAAARRHLIEVTKDIAAVMTANAAADTAMTQAGRRHAEAFHAARSALDAVAPTGATPPGASGADRDSASSPGRSGTTPREAARSSRTRRPAAGCGREGRHSEQADQISRGPGGRGRRVRTGPHPYPAVPCAAASVAGGRAGHHLRQRAVRPDRPVPGGGDRPGQGSGARTS